MDGHGYSAYKQIAGRYDFGEYVLFIDKVQSDPFASPSRVRIHIPAGVTGLPTDLIQDPAGRVAAGDFLARRAAEAIRRHGKGIRGSGKSGLIQIDCPGQEILERTAVSVRAGGIVDARLYVGLPAKGRQITAAVLKHMIRREIPPVIKESFLHQNLDGAALDDHVRWNRDQDRLRSQLRDQRLVAFLPDGARLPRRSGVDDRPLEGDHVVALESPPELHTTLSLDSGRTVSGLGIPAGVTLIVGGGFHGKSTLLHAVERGVYNHVPGDGREGVVTDPTAFKVRAEDGRKVEKVDISPFVENLPFGRDTRAFSTDLASGSTSQAAGIMEVLAAGARVLLLDEDTSATNFLIRDRRMQLVVPPESEPITPFIDRARDLHGRLGVSTLLVLGGCGDYLDVADTVLHMDAFVPRDATARAREVAAAHPTGRIQEAPPLPENPFPRRTLLPASFVDPDTRRGDAKIHSRGRDTLLYGKKPVDISALEQIVDASQVTALAEGLRLAREDFTDGRRTVEEVVSLVMERIQNEGLDVLTRRPTGGLARFRGLELAAVINRMRSLRVVQEETHGQAGPAGSA